MNLIGKLIISLVVAGTVYGAAQFVTGLVTGLPVFVLLLAATLGTSLLTSFPVGGSPATATQTTSTSASTSKRSSQKATKTTPRETKPKDSKPNKQTPHKEPAPVATSTASGPREEGEVKWFNISKGFGFITKDDGEEIFVHFRSIRGEGRRGLKDGQRVSFVHADSDKGPQAEDVEAL